MFGLPMHPLIVHFPIVLVFLLPVSVAFALWGIRKGTTPRRAWALPLGVAAALALSAFVSTQTGEAQEERVEEVVPRAAMHNHEEAAERFLVLSGVLLIVAAGGLLPRTLGKAARVVTAAGAVGLIAAGAQVGHTGGSLVYRYDAASAYTSAAGQEGVASAPTGSEEDKDNEDDEFR